MQVYHLPDKRWRPATVENGAGCCLSPSLLLSSPALVSQGLRGSPTECPLLGKVDLNMRI